MINNYIKEKLDLNNVRTLDQFINIIREECQKIILYSLSKTDFFSKVAFYGGTCLRIFHNLNRYSEDLDFNIIKPNLEIDLDDYLEQTVIDLEAFGFKTIIRSKEQYDQGEMRRRYVTIPIYDFATEYFKIPVTNKEQVLSIKLEISTNYIDGGRYERKLLSSPLFSNILCFDYPSLFAGKLCALINRNWRNREKGRDYYDFMFYLSHEIKLNFEYIKSKLGISSLTLNQVKEMLIDRFNDTNFDSVKDDVGAFVIGNYDLDSFNKNNFIQAVELLQISDYR